MSQTGSQDERYNLVSVLYHAPQGSDTIGKSMTLRATPTSLPFGLNAVYFF